MRRFDKNKHITNANLLAEQRHLDRGLITEGAKPVYAEEEFPFKLGSKVITFNIKIKEGYDIDTGEFEEFNNSIEVFDSNLGKQVMRLNFKKGYDGNVTVGVREVKDLVHYFSDELLKTVNEVILKHFPVIE